MLSLSFYICLFRLSCPSGSPSFWDKDRRPLKETALRCSNTEISHPDHPRMVRMVYLLTDVDPKLPMYVKKAAKRESRATLSVNSGLAG